MSETIEDDVVDAAMAEQLAAAQERARLARERLGGETDAPSTPGTPVAEDSFIDRLGNAVSLVAPTTGTLISKVDDISKLPGQLADIAGAIPHGVIDGINETLALATQAASYLPVIGEPLDVLFRDEKGNFEAPNAIPQIFPEQDTQAGRAAESISQFLVGFAGAGKVKLATGATTLVGKGAQAMFRGALADFASFDGHEERLSNLVEANPELRNPITAFLAANEEDGEIVGRLKSALEGLGLGALTDSLLAGLRTIKAGRAAQAGIKQVEQADEVFRTVTAEEAARSEAELLDIVRGIDADESADAGGRARPEPDLAGDPDRYLRNLTANLDTPDAVKKAIRSLVEKDLPAVDRSRRGWRTWEKTVSEAEKLDAFRRLDERRLGEAFNAEELFAARSLVVSSARNTLRAANLYARTKSKAAAAALQEVVDRHALIQEEYMGVRAEAGRALNILRKTGKDDMAFLIDLDNAVSQGGGTAAADEMAKRIMLLGTKNPDVLNEFVLRSRRARTADAIGEIWRGALLSNPKTHITNALSNLTVMAYDIAETYTTGRIGRLLGDEAAADLVGESSAKAVGLRTAFADQFRYLRRYGQFDNKGVQISRLDAKTERGMSAVALGMRDQGALAQSVNVIGTIFRKPQEALGFADDLFKGVNYQAELHAQAHRRAAREARSGIIDRADIPRRMDELIENPTNRMIESARNAAMERTFTKPAERGSITQAAHSIRSGMNAAGLPFGHIVLPFINTPANIMQYSFSRTPVGYLMEVNKRAFAAGGEEAALAHARIAMGTATLFLSMDYAMSGQSSGGGPKDAAERQLLERTGWRPNSIKIGDQWVDHSRFDPFSTWLSLGASMHEILANAEREEVEDAGLVMSQLAGAIGNAALSKTYLTGLSDVVSLINDADREGNYFGRVGSSFVPAVSAELRRFDDPYMRDAQSTVSMFRNRIPTLSDDLPVSHDLWGRPRMYQSHLGAVYDGFSPFIVRKVDPEPIDTELMRLGYAPLPAERSLSVPLQGQRVGVSLKSRPDIYQRYVALAGNEGKYFEGGLGAKDALNKVIETPQYRQLLADGSETFRGTKAAYIRGVIVSARERARDQLFVEFRDDLTAMAARQYERVLDERRQQEASAAAQAAEMLLQEQR